MTPESRDRIREAYKILELSEGASLDEIRAQFHLLGAVWHPDRFPYDSNRYYAADAKFRAINAAHELLVKALEAGACTQPEKQLPDILVDTEVRYLGSDPRLPNPGFFDWSGLSCAIQVSGEGLQIGIPTAERTLNSQQYHAADIQAMYYGDSEWNREGIRKYRSSIAIVGEFIGSPRVWLACRDPAGIVSTILVKLQFRGEYQRRLFLETTAKLLGFNPDEVVPKQPTVRTQTASPPQKPESPANDATSSSSTPIGPEMKPSIALEGTPKAEEDLLKDAIPAGIMLLVVLVAVLLAVAHSIQSSVSKSTEISRINDSSDGLDGVPFGHETHRPAPSHRLRSLPNPTTSTAPPRSETTRRLSGSANELDTAGKTHFANGEYQLAIDTFSEAIRIDGRNSMTFSNRGLVWHQLQQWEAARRDYEKALLLDPNNAFALNNLAWLWASCPAEKHRDGKAAVVFATKACNLVHPNTPPNFQGTLAAAYAESGDFDKAVACQTRALTSATDPDQRREMANRLDSYRRRIPVREPLATR